MIFGDGQVMLMWANGTIADFFMSLNSNIIVLDPGELQKEVF